MYVIFTYEKNFIISESQREKVKKVINQAKFIEIHDTLIAVSQIQRIQPYEPAPYFMGKPMTPDLKFVLTQEGKKPFDRNFQDKIEWRDELPPNTIDARTNHEKEFTPLALPWFDMDTHNDNKKYLYEVSDEQRNENMNELRSIRKRIFPK